MKLARDVDDEADPAASMIDDEDAVIVAKWAGKLHDAIGRHGNVRTSSGRERQPARADAAGIHRGETIGDRRSGGKLVGERRSRASAFGRKGAEWRGIFGGSEMRRNSADRLTV